MEKRFWQRVRLPSVQCMFMALTVSALLILALGQFTNIDLLIEDYYYDAQSQAFPWKNSWFTKDFMHGLVKNVIIKSGYLLIIFVLADAVMSWKKLTPFMRGRLRFVALSSILVPALIRAMKQFSVLHCPWSVDRYGGSEPFLRLLQDVPQGLKAGHCFPAGHATVGFWLAALCVFFLPHRPKAAVGVFLAGLSAGLILGWVQQMRGAHFLFHTLWAAWLSSLVIFLMLVVFADQYLDIGEEKNP